MIRWLAVRMMMRCETRMDIALRNFRESWTGADMTDWERSYDYWRRRAEWWGGWL